MWMIFLLYSLFACVFVISKTGLEYSQPIFLVGSRMLLAGLIILGFQYLFRRERFNFQKRDFWLIIRLAVVNIYLTNVFEFWGLQSLSPSKTCFLYSLSPFLSALFSYWMFSETMTAKKWLGMIIGFLGIVPIMLTESRTEMQQSHLLGFSWGELSVLIAVVCSVYGWILLRDVVKERGYSPMMANGMSMAVGGSIALMHSSLVETWDPLPITEGMPFLACFVLLIIVSNLICYNLYGFLLKRFTATLISFAGLSTPLFTALFAWIWFGEIVGWPFFLSAFIVFIGLSLFYQEELKQGYYAPGSAVT